MLSQRCASRSTANCRPAGRAFFSGKPIHLAAKQTSSSRRRPTVMKTEHEQVGAAYAIALVELAEADGNLEGVHADVDGLTTVLNENSDMSEFLMNPIVSDEKKRALLDKIGQEAGFTESTVKFLKLIVDKGRIECVQEICEAFEVKYCELTDTQVASVRSAVKLDQEQQFQIAKKLQELTGSKNIKLKPVLDKNLVAGFIVEYGSSQIDLSIKGQVGKIQAEMELEAGLTTL